MELKYDLIIAAREEVENSNRTFMELKFKSY